MLKMKLSVLQAIRNAGGRHASQRGMASITAWLLLVFLSAAASAMAATYYVDSNAGSDSNAGTSLSSPFKSLQKVNTMNLMPGDSVLLNRGAAWSEGLEIQRSGLQESDLFFGAYGSGAAPIIRYAKVDGDFVTLADLTVDRNKEAADAVQVTSDSCTLLNLTVRNGTRDGIDIHNSNNILIENCRVHHFLNGTFTNQADAHGIVATATQMLTIRNTEVHHVSGDSFQADPNRDPNNITNNILIENCHFWTGPLTEDFNSGWIKTSHLSDSQKQYPGENAIDTKVVKTGWENVPRMLLHIRNTTMNGWKKDGYVSNKAALNLKEKIQVTLDGVTVFDNEIGFRLRGGLGNADITIMNAVVYNCEYAVRTEDNIGDLAIYNSTFGSNIGTMLRTVSSTTGFDTWQIQNNAFLGTKPELAAHSSNAVVSANEADSVFQGVTSNNYHLQADAKLIDTGITLSEVGHDCDGDTRVAPYDIGAYEYSSSVDSGTQTGALAAVRNLRITASIGTGSDSDGGGDTDTGSDSDTETDSDTEPGHDSDSGSETGDNHGDSTTHFINESERLAAENSLVFAADLGSQSNIDQYCYGQCTDVVYDPSQSAAKLRSGGGDLDLSWPAITSGKVYIQVETKFDPGWSTIDHNGGSLFKNGKFLRPRQDSVKTDDPRCFDFQLRMYGYSGTGKAGLPTLRSYASSPTEGDDPLRYGDDIQPGGVSTYYYYPTGIWIRETYEVDLDSGRIRVWMSDEKNDTKLLISDPSRTDLGFFFNPTSAFNGIDRIRLGINSSSSYPSPSVYHWHRNLIVSKIPVSLNGRPN